jgi:hypothetical protein
MCRLTSSVIIISISWFTLTVGQNLVLIGGNLRNDNTQIWNKMVDLAVSILTQILLWLADLKKQSIQYRADRAWLESESSQLLN